MPHLCRSVTVVALGAFLLKATLALSTYGSTDVLIYEADVAKLVRDGAVALYQDGVQTAWCGHQNQQPCPPFIHPPFIIDALKGWHLLAQISGLPFRFWLRLTCAAADLGSLVVLFRVLRRQLSEMQTHVALLWFAASPVTILVSGFHGNTDPILMFFMLLAIDFIEGGRPAWFAGIAFGAAMNIKVLPIVLVPVALLSLPDMRRRLAFCGGVIGAWLAGSLPFLLMAPDLLVRQVFGYSSQSGSWGLSLFAMLLRESVNFSWLGELYLRWSKALTICLILSSTFWLRHLSRRNVLSMSAGFLMFLFVSVIPGFGVQYLAWLVPWVVGLGFGPAASFHITATAFLVAYYVTSAGAFPWYLANSLARPAWTGTVLGLGLICWVVVSCIAAIYAVRLESIRIQTSFKDKG